MLWGAAGALGALAAYAGARGLGASRWTRATRALNARIAADPPAMSAAGCVDLALLDELPPPVRRYFHTVLRDGQPRIAAARFAHTGRFDIGRGTPRWRDFTSSQRVVIDPPGFVWDGHIAMLPGLAMRVHDAYAGGEGLLHAALFGLFTLVDDRDADELARGELMRFVAEAPLYPTALLPAPGVVWSAVDAHTADLRFSDHHLSVTLRFTFSADGLIETVTVPARGRSVGGRLVPTRWQGRWFDYRHHSGMLVPTRGEVAWLLDDGAKPYWRGTLLRADYETGRGARPATAANPPLDRLELT